MSPVRLELPAQLSAEHAATLTELADELDAALAEKLLGLVLSGSAGRGRADSDSDLDLIAVISEDADHPTTRRLLVDLIPVTLAHVQRVADFGDDQWGYRWSWAWAPVLLDRTHGALTAAVERQTRLSADEISDILLRHGRLDAWINLAYRVLKSDRRGDAEAAALDGAESVPVFLDVVFALAGLVRPYNSSLRWTLEHHPLAPELRAVLDSWPPQDYGVLYR